MIFVSIALIAFASLMVLFVGAILAVYAAAAIMDGRKEG